MNRSEFRKTIKFVLGIVGTLTGVAFSVSKLDECKKYKAGLVYVGFCGLILFVFLLFLLLIHKFRRTGSGERHMFLSTWELRYATEDDLNAVVRLGRLKIGVAHPSVADLLPFLKRNQEIIEVIAHKYFPTEILAYYWIYPLNDDATERIRRASVRNAKGLRVNDLTDFSSATSIYFAMIAGSDWRTKAAILACFSGRILSLLASTNSIRYFFARAATNDGKRLMSASHFVPLGSNSEISQVEREHMEKLMQIRNASSEED